MSLGSPDESTDESLDAFEFELLDDAPETIAQTPDEVPDDRGPDEGADDEPAVALVPGTRAPYTVPDFAADAEVIARYDAAVKAVVQAAIGQATRTMRHDFEMKRRELQLAAAKADADLKVAEAAAFSARARYAALVPKHRTASGVVRPPTLFFDVLLTGGAANKYYDAAVKTAREAKEAGAAQRTAARDLEAMQGTADGAVVKRELELRRHFKSPEGKAELDAHPDVKPLAVHCEAIEAERAEYAARLAAGEVSDEEQRDRTMALEGLRFLDGSLRNVQCLRDRNVRFGNLRYMTFRDREHRLWLLDGDEALQALAVMHFDITHMHGRYLIARALPMAKTIAEVTMDHKHRGPDPRAALGVDPMLLRALRDFVERERVSV